MAAFRDWLHRLYDAALSPVALVATVVGQLTAVMIAWAFEMKPEPEAASAIGMVWQVHATFVSVGFAGLAIAFQVVGEPPLSAGLARRAVIRHLHFGGLLFSGATASAVLGVAMLVFPSPAVAVASLIVVLAPSLLLVALAYSKLAELWSQPSRIESLTLDGMTRDVAGAAASAAKNDQLARNCEQAIAGAARGLTLETLDQFAPGMPTRVFRFPWYDGRVQSVNVGVLVMAADQLAWFVLQARTHGVLFSYDYKQRIQVHVRAGHRYRTGQSTFEVHDWPGVNDIQWAVIERMLNASLTVDTDLAGDPEHVFGEEMGELQDNVLATIAGHRLSGLRKGYEYYDQAIFKVRATVVTTSNGTITPRWFHSQLWEIDEAAARSGPRFALPAIADAQHQAMSALRAGELAYFQFALDRVIHVWDRLLPQGQAAVGAVENILVSLQNLAMFMVPHESALAGPARSRAALQILETFASLMKAAFDAGEYDIGYRVMGYVGVLYDV